MANSMMSEFRVLDLTDKKGWLCGKVLAELGMDVIKVEPPAGDPSRSLPPFYHDEADPEKSLFWYSYNTGKRDVTLDLESEEGKKLFKKLVAKSDFVIESFAPGYMKSIGLGYEELCEVRPNIIMASLTPFGQSGPHANWPSESDLVIQALATMLNRTGDPDRAPVKISDVPQSWLHGCMDCVEALMIANYYRSVSGEGQYIDCAIIESIIGDPVSIGDFNALGQEGKRSGSVYSGSGKHIRTIWPCADGFIYFQIRGGGTGLKNNALLIQWMDEEGECPAFLKEMDWSEFNWFKVPQERMDKIASALGPFFKTRKKRDQLAEANRRGMIFGLVADAEDLLTDEQFKARDYWVDVDYGEQGRITYPGPFAKFSETPLTDFRRAPRIGENNAEVYKELCGLDADALRAFESSGVI